ncbi:MAG: hypothetical protein AB4426_23615 [Xenococcaceae cyanobacterium]
MFIKKANYFVNPVRLNFRRTDHEDKGKGVPMHPRATVSQGRLTHDFHCRTAEDTNVPQAESVQVDVMRIPPADTVPEHCPSERLPD